MWFVEAFLAMFVLNALWTYTIRKLIKDETGTALITDGALVACQGLVTVAYAENGLIVVFPAVLGSTLGLWMACKIDQRRRKTGDR